MNNTTFMIGRLVDKPKVQESDNGKKRASITVAVQRPYKNQEGVYETDFIDCVLWEGIAESASEYCEKGDLIGIKGRLQTNLYEKDGKTNKSTEIVAEKISFLSSRSRNIEENKSKESEKKKTKTKSKDKEL